VTEQFGGLAEFVFSFQW